MDSFSKETLQRLYENDPSLRILQIGPSIVAYMFNRSSGRGVFDPSNCSISDMGRLGKIIGNNTHVQKLRFDGLDGFTVNSVKAFLEGLRANTSIDSIKIGGMLDFSDLYGAPYSLLAGIGYICSGIFTSKTRQIEIVDSNLGVNGAKALTSTIRKCAGLRVITLKLVDVDDDELTELVFALRYLYYLLSLEFIRTGGLRPSGCNAVSTLLRDATSNLHTLNISRNGIHNDEAIAIANSLATNKKLKHINLSRNPISQQGWDAFARTLCNVDSTNDTYLSNHTLQTIAYHEALPANLTTNLVLNQSSSDTKAIAIKKILLNNPHLDMEPLFHEKELQLLPLVVDWFDRARAINYDSHVERKKLSGIYQFVRSMPLMFVPTSSKKARRDKRTRYKRATSNG